MSAPATNLAPPKVRSDRPNCADPQNDPISLAQLAAHDGKDPSKPIYVAIKGKVFDVSAKKEMYGPGAGYNIFAGKDASKGLGEYSPPIVYVALTSSGMSSLDPKDAIADYSSLTEAQVKTLDQWEAFFEKVDSETRSLVRLLTF